jgi:hypothetical protein
LMQALDSLHITHQSVIEVWLKDVPFDFHLHDASPIGAQLKNSRR